jgi:hypothetical protein
LQLLQSASLALTEEVPVIEWKKRDAAAATSATAAASDWSGTGGKLLRRTLMSVSVHSGNDYTPAGGGPTVRAVDLEVVRPEFYKEYFADGDEETKKAAKQKAFKRAITSAREDGLVGIEDNALGRTMIWLTRPEDARDDSTGRR